MSVSASAFHFLRTPSRKEVSFYMRMFAEASRSFYVHCISRQRGIADDGKTSSTESETRSVGFPAPSEGRIRVQYRYSVLS